MLPNLIIAGAPKSGTSSFFSYLSQHPDICPATKKELHYFTPITSGKEQGSIDDYARFFTHCSPSAAYRMEASPGYMYGGSMVASKMNEILGNECKIIFILREPEDRHWSHYKHLYKMETIPAKQDYLSFTEEGIQQVTEWGIAKEHKSMPWRAVRAGLYSSYISQWIDVMGNERVKVLFFDNLVVDTEKTVRDICDWLGLDREVDFRLQAVFNKSMPVKRGILHSSAIRTSRFFERVMPEQRQLKEKLRSLYFFINKRSNSDMVSQKKQAHELLRLYYHEYNNELKKLLIDHGYHELPEWLS